MSRLDGKIALITGAAKGQGEVEAKLFAKEGAHVILTDILDTEGSKVESEITELGGDALYKRLDVSSENEWASISQFIEDKYGRLDILLNNAGASVRNTAMDISMEDWDLMMNVNAKGVFLGTKYCVPIMQKSGGGSIINISSIAGIAGRPMASPAYAASKGAILSLTRQMSLDYANENIRVLAVCPGAIDTKMVREVAQTESDDTEDTDAVVARYGSTHPLGRIGLPVDIANVVLFLASDKASFMTGEYICVDGGYNAVGSSAGAARDSISVNK